MAKGKHAAALFEVIHSGKRPEKAAGALRTPNWWFKGRPVQHPAPDVEMEEQVHYAPPEPEPDPQLTAPRPQVSRRRTRMQSESHSHELTMRMRFSTLVVGGFCLLVLVGVAYVIGRHVAGGPESATASALNSGDVRQQPAVRGALDVPRRTTRTNGNTGTTNSNSTARRSDPARVRDVATPLPQADIAQPETTVEATGPREFGLNYIVVMTYPPDRKDVAQQACDYLGKHGIACSVEEAPPFFHRGWWAVITRKGFVKTTSDPAYNACMERIEKLTPGFKSTPRSDPFSPTAFKLK